MPKKLSEQQKKQAALYISNGLSITSKRKFEKEVKYVPELEQYVKELKAVIETTRSFSTISPTEELVQGSRNLLRGRIQEIDSRESTATIIAKTIDILKSGVSSIARKQQPAWAVITYVVVGLLIGRLILAPNNNKPIDINGQEQLDMNNLIQSGILSDILIDQSAIPSSSIRLVSHTDDRFNVSGNVNDTNIRQILYYLLLNDEDADNRFQAGKQIQRITPNSESRRVLITSALSETDNKVKLQSIRTLSQYPSSPDLINACKRILLDDRNTDMRLEALNILENNMSTDLVSLLQVVGTMDDNLTIRDKAKDLLLELQKPVSIDNYEVTK